MGGQVLLAAGGGKKKKKKIWKKFSRVVDRERRKYCVEMGEVRLGEVESIEL